MAKIDAYELKTDAAAPSAGRAMTAQDFGGVSEGMRQVGGAIQQTAEVIDKRASQAEVSSLSAKLAEAQMSFSKELNETLAKADPADREVAAKFMQSYDERMAKVGEDLSTNSGRLFYEKASAEMRAHFGTAASAGQVKLAGIQAEKDYKKSLNSLSSGVINDPSSANMAFNVHAHGIDALVDAGVLPREKALELKSHGETEIAKSAARGMIRVNPEYAKQQLDSGVYDSYINGDAKHQLYGEVEMAKNAKRIEAERLDSAARKAQKDLEDKTQSEILQQIHDGQITAQQILDRPELRFDAKNQMLNILEKSKDDKLKTDPVTYNALFKRIHLPDGDPKKIVDQEELNAWMGRGITLSDLNSLRGEVEGKHTEAGEQESQLKAKMFKTAESMLVKSNPMMGIRDPDGEMHMQQFTLQVQKDFKAGRKAGIPAAKLLDPDAPEYVGKIMRNFARSPDQIVKSYLPETPQPSPNVSPNPGSSSVPGSDQSPSGAASATTPGAAPSSSSEKARRPGESAAAYLKRINGK